MAGHMITSRRICRLRRKRRRWYVSSVRPVNSMVTLCGGNGHVGSQSQCLDVAILGELRQCGDLYERARLVPATSNLSMDSAPTALPMVPVSITMARRLTSGIPAWSSAIIAEEIDQLPASDRPPGQPASGVARPRHLDYGRERMTIVVLFGRSARRWRATAPIGEGTAGKWSLKLVRILTQLVRKPVRTATPREISDTITH